MDHGPTERTRNEAVAVHGSAGHRDLEGAGDLVTDGGRLPNARDRLADVLEIEGLLDGMGVSKARRLEGLKHENVQLKKVLAEAMLDRAFIKDVTSINGTARRDAEGSGACRGGPRRKQASGVRSACG